jgi:hypothetical protein
MMGRGGDNIGRDANRDTSNEEDGRRENKKPRGDPPRPSLEREELPLYIFLLQMYFKGNFGNPPRVFTGASKKSGKSSRPPKKERDLYGKVHTWSASWKKDKCPFVHCVVRLRSKAQAHHDEFGRSHWELFIESLGRHLQESQLRSQNKDSDDDSEEY